MTVKRHRDPIIQVAVSYTHLDVYKRQGLAFFSGILSRPTDMINPPARRVEN
ncbi:hypothetical protein [Erwinia amylovora]